jgi:1-deoxy-D-xylulose-5-phosphate reductoisomerase
MTSDAPLQVALLGSTGSVGKQALDVVEAHPESFEVVGLVANSNETLLREQARKLNVEDIGLGAKDAVEMARRDDVDVVLNAIVGAAGLRASVAALETGKSLALANKESLVAGGRVCLDAALRGGGRIIPVDSEHAAIAHCLQGARPSDVKRIILTASGGPFRTHKDLSRVTPDDALAHPTWEMGPKITIDCATLMNKGLEVIEAHYLFDFDFDSIDVVVHPRSLVHGIVEFVDGSCLMQAAPADMRIPIQSALGGGDKLPTDSTPIDFQTVGSLDFEPVDHERFPALELARGAGALGEGRPAALNAANEIAVGGFLEGHISFTEITEVVDATLSAHRPVADDSLDTVIEVDAWARDYASGIMSMPAKGSVRHHKAVGAR